MSAETENHSAASGDLEHSGTHEAAYLRASLGTIYCSLSSLFGLPDDGTIIASCVNKIKNI